MSHFSFILPLVSLQLSYFVIFPQENQRLLGYIYVLHRTIGSAWISGKAQLGVWELWQ